MRRITLPFAYLLMYMLLLLLLCMCVRMHLRAARLCLHACSEHRGDSCSVVQSHTAQLC